MGTAVKTGANYRSLTTRRGGNPQCELCNCCCRIAFRLSCPQRTSSHRGRLHLSRPDNGNPSSRYGDRDGASLSSFALRTVLGGHQSTGRTCLAASKPPRWQNCSRHPLEELHLARGFARAAPVRTNSGKTKFNCKHPMQYIDAVQCHRLQCDWGASCRQNAAILTVFGNSSPFSSSLYLYRDSVLMACVSEVS